MGISLGIVIAMVRVTSQKSHLKLNVFEIQYKI